MKFTMGFLALVLSLSPAAFAEMVPAPAAEARVPGLDRAGELGRAMEAAINKGEGATFDTKFNVDLLLDRALGVLKADDALQRGFRTGVKRKFVLGQRIVEGMGKDGTYTLRRVYQKEGKAHLLFRMNSEAGLNYHDMLVEPGVNGAEPTVTDIYIYLAGENLSETLKRGYLPLVAEQRAKSDRTFLMSAHDEAYCKHLSTLTELGKVTVLRDGAKWLRIYKTLPAELQRDRNLAMVRTQMAVASKDDAEYLEALEFLKKVMPDDPAADLISIDSLVLREKFADAQAALLRLNKAVGPDGELLGLAAGMAHKAGDKQKAYSLVDDAMRAEPKLVSPYWVLLTLSLTDKDFVKSVKMLNEIETKFELSMGDLQGVPIYAEFVKSPEYKKWMAGRTAK